MFPWSWFSVGLSVLEKENRGAGSTPVSVGVADCLFPRGRRSFIDLLWFPAYRRRFRTVCSNGSGMRNVRPETECWHTADERFPLGPRRRCRRCRRRGGARCVFPFFAVSGISPFHARCGLEKRKPECMKSSGFYGTETCYLP